MHHTDNLCCFCSVMCLKCGFCFSNFSFCPSKVLSTHQQQDPRVIMSKLRIFHLCVNHISWSVRWSWFWNTVLYWYKYLLSRTISSGTSFLSQNIGIWLKFDGVLLVHRRRRHRHPSVFLMSLVSVPNSSSPTELLALPTRGIKSNFDNLCFFFSMMWVQCGGWSYITSHAVNFCCFFSVIWLRCGRKGLLLFWLVFSVMRFPYD